MGIAFRKKPDVETRNFNTLLVRLLGPEGRGRNAGGSVHMATARSRVGLDSAEAAFIDEHRVRGLGLWSFRDRYGIPAPSGSSGWSHKGAASACWRLPAEYHWFAWYNAQPRPNGPRPTSGSSSERVSVHPGHPPHRAPKHPAPGTRTGTQHPTPSLFDYLHPKLV